MVIQKKIKTGRVLEQMSEFYLLHFRCLHMIHIYHKQKCPNGTNKYNFSEQRNVERIYTWTLCSLVESILFLYSIVSISSKLLTNNSKLRFYF